MGESEEQAKGLIVEDSSPVLYTLKLKLSEIPDNRILRLQEKDWIYAVLANRRRIEEFNKLYIANYWINELNKYDVVRKYAYEKKLEGRDIVSKITIEYRNRGQYLDEILKDQRTTEVKGGI